ncbi:hypothetical protein JHW43_005646 [Diplocarpon mali]|nr:hypothetical protein JHW43_005646 [Diplocarpon mali]
MSLSIRGDPSHRPHAAQGGWQNGALTSPQIPRSQDRSALSTWNLFSFRRLLWLTAGGMQDCPAGSRGLYRGAEDSESKAFRGQERTEQRLLCRVLIAMPMKKASRQSRAEQSIRPRDAGLMKRRRGADRLTAGTASASSGIRRTVRGQVPSQP